jgi:hypothetical protein
MQITAEIDIADIVESLTHGYGDNDPINFIMTIDESIGDEAFTEDLLLRLAENYEKEYASYEKVMLERSLSKTFVEGANANVLELVNIDLKYATTKREKLSRIVALIKSLNSYSNE